jgi:uncharacterized delta-60 repeat protein
MMARARAARPLTFLLLLLLVIVATPLQTTVHKTVQITTGQNGNTITREQASQLGSYWAKTYGDGGWDEAHSIQQTTDGGYIVAGTTNSFGADSDAWVLKLSYTGSVVWQKTYGGNGSDGAESVQQTTDGGYIVAGGTDSSFMGYTHAWVLKLSSTGSVVWQKTYGSNRTDNPWNYFYTSGVGTAYSVEQTSDGGYIVGGGTGWTGHLWVLKLGCDGSVVWQKTYGGMGRDTAYSVQQTSDGGYIVAGTAGTNAAYRFWVLKLNSTGSVTWQNMYGELPWGFSMAHSIQQISDGGYVVAGWAGTEFTPGRFGAAFWVLKLNSTGSVTWGNAYGGNASSDVATAIEQTTDGGYIVAGSTWSFGAGNGDVWVLKLNSTGSVTWGNAYGGNATDFASSVEQTADGGYIVAGSTDSFGAGDSDFWVSKLDSTGSLVWNAGSGASTQMTNVTALEYSAFVFTEPVEEGNSTMAVQDTRATPHVTNATITAQSGPEIIPPAAITDLAAGNPTDTTVTLTWTAPGDNGTIGTAKGYVVMYSTRGPINASNLDFVAIYNQTWVPLPGGGNESHVVSGLMPSTMYWLALVAYDQAINYGGLSNSPSATTRSDPTLILALAMVVGAPAITVEIAIYLSRRRREFHQAP